MAEYYFLASFLPMLEIGHVPALGFDELKELLKVNLTPGDLQKTRRFLRLVDLENLRALWSGEPHDPRGNLTRAELEETVNEGIESIFPEFFRIYLERYTTKEERLTHFHELMSRYLLEQSEKEKGFLSEYFAFERNLRLVLVGFRAKKLQWDVLTEFAREDPREPIIAEILAQKDAKSYEPPFEFRELKPILEAYSSSPLELNRALSAYRFSRIQEIASVENFSIDRILSYMARLILVERWLELDVQKGMEIIHKIEERIG